MKKILKIKVKSPKWLQLRTPVGVKTDNSVEYCNKVYFNGYEPVYKITYNDNSSYSSTGNHKFLTQTLDWVRTDMLEVGTVMNNGLVIVSIEPEGVKPTIDIEVPEKHYYILENGVYSHNTSYIYGNVSPGVEPRMSNYYLRALAGIQDVYKNPNLEQLLEAKGKNTPDIWASILENLGSVQHLDFLTDQEKEVFRTASEISPKDILDLASDRQEFIDMAQSLNLFNRPNYTLKDIYDIHMYAFNNNIKTLYYFYPQAHAALEKVGKKWDDCVSCAD